MVSPTIPVAADSSEGNFGDTIDIGVDVIHPVPVASVAFPAVTVELTAPLRNRVEIVEAEKENAYPRPLSILDWWRAIAIGYSLTNKDSLVLRLSVSWLRFRSPTVRTERTSRSSRNS
ncbi:hypothetical protein Tco_1497053 [Tanacetum coccineum]